MGGEARENQVLTSCLIIIKKNNTGEGGEEGVGNRLLLGAQSYARAQKVKRKTPPLQLLACIFFVWLRY